ncbi:MAG TPA: cell envelope integrity protein TolA [Steroidobacteraceae bacterium]
MQRASDRWVSIALSVLLHGALLAALVYGWLMFRQPTPPKPTLAIEATVVDARAVRGAVRPPPQPAPPAAPTPPQQPQEPVGPPPPTPEDLARREQQRQQAQEAAAQERRAAEQKAAEQQAAQARQAEEQRKTEERAAAERKAREAAEAHKRAAEERQRQADAQDIGERQAELQRSLAAEERASVARSGAALASWESQIAARITRAWLRPPTARPGIQCVLYVTQVPGGEVTQVSIGECNGDQAVRESIEAAVYRASPLPPPPDPALFDRNLKINFKPD